MTLIKESLAIMEKETKLNLRFKFSFVVSSLTNPVLALIPFLLVYYGFFHFSGATSFAEVNQNNYVNFLVLGMLVNAFFYTGLYMFYSKFMNEKYWKTMEAIFLTPINYLSMVFGISASEIIRMIPTIIVFMAISALFIVPNPLVFLLVLVVLFLVFLISSGLD